VHRPVRLCVAKGNVQETYKGKKNFMTNAKTAGTVVSVHVGGWLQLEQSD
jgi:hypothetical protein